MTATETDATPTRLVEAAARLLAEGGPTAVTARKVTAAVGLSTIAVYTHFGSMDGLLAAVWREGFGRFGVELQRPGLTDDPVADWMCQAWGYRHFALREPHLYQVMFGRGLERAAVSPDDVAAAGATFELLVERLRQCVEAGRFSIDDLALSAHAVWSTVHGHMSIELAGSHTRVGVDPVATYEECLLRGALGFGDDEGATRLSLRSSRRRARRLGLIGP